MFSGVFLSPPHFCGQFTVWGEEQEQPHSVLGKVGGTTTQIRMHYCNRLYLVKFWLFLFQCPSNTGVIRRKLGFVSSCFWPPRAVMAKPGEAGGIWNCVMETGGLDLNLCSWLWHLCCALEKWGQQFLQLLHSAKGTLPIQILNWLCLALCVVEFWLPQKQFLWIC